MKLTAANSPFLRAHKATWNKVIYKRLVAIVNADGEAAGRTYLRQFVRPETDLDALASHCTAVMARKGDR